MHLVDLSSLEPCVARCAITVVYDEGEDPITPAHELSLVDIKRFCCHTRTLLFIGVHCTLFRTICVGVNCHVV